MLQLLAAAGVVAGNPLARWFAVAVLGLSAIDMMFFIPAYPFWSLVIIAADVVALYALCAYGSRANLQARLTPAVGARRGRSPGFAGANGPPADARRSLGKCPVEPGRCVRGGRSLPLTRRSRSSGELLADGGGSGDHAWLGAAGTVVRDAAFDAGIPSPVLTRAR